VAVKPVESKVVQNSSVVQCALLAAVLQEHGLREHITCHGFLSTTPGAACHSSRHLIIASHEQTPLLCTWSSTVKLLLLLLLLLVAKQRPQSKHTKA
jgi:hypothetical protein